MTKVSLTAEQATDLITQLQAALEGRQPILDIVMPNGKKMIDCSGQYVGEVSKALHRFGSQDFIEMERLVALSPLGHN